MAYYQGVLGTHILSGVALEGECLRFELDLRCL